MFFNKFKSNKKADFKIDKENLPKHVAIIMDGNGRWAKKRSLPRAAGHTAGAKALEDIIETSKELGLEYLSVYAFSTENWKRSDEEVEDIMKILRSYLKNQFERFLSDNVKMKVIGDKTRLDLDIQERIKVIEKESENKTGLTVLIALNYGGRNEIVRGIKALTKDILEGRIQYEDIAEDEVSKYLDTANIPDPELLIRTSGEERISNFFLWQIAYSEFYFTDTLWPDFNKNELEKAIYYYQNRERHFGGR